VGEAFDLLVRVPFSDIEKPPELPDKDRRERARIVVNGGAAILLSAPIFDLRPRPLLSKVCQRPHIHQLGVEEEAAVDVAD